VVQVIGGMLLEISQLAAVGAVIGLLVGYVTKVPHLWGCMGGCMAGLHGVAHARDCMHMVAWYPSPPHDGLIQPPMHPLPTVPVLHASAPLLPAPRGGVDHAGGRLPHVPAERCVLGMLCLEAPCLLCCAVLCCAVLCCAVLCCAVLCCAVLYAHSQVPIQNSPPSKPLLSFQHPEPQSITASLASTAAA